MIYFSIEKERKRAWWKFQVPRNIWSHWFARALFRESFFLLEKRKGKKNKKEKKEKKKKDRFLVELFFFFFFFAAWFRDRFLDKTAFHAARDT